MIGRIGNHEVKPAIMIEVARGSPLGAGAGWVFKSFQKLGIEILGRGRNVSPAAPPTAAPPQSGRRKKKKGNSVDEEAQFQIGEQFLPYNSGHGRLRCITLYLPPRGLNLNLLGWAAAIRKAAGVAEKPQG